MPESRAAAVALVYDMSISASTAAGSRCGARLLKGERFVRASRHQILDVEDHVCRRGSMLLSGWANTDLALP